MTGRPYPVPDVHGISRSITYGALVDPRALVQGPFFASRTVIHFKNFNERKQSNVTNLNRIVSRGQSYSNCLRTREISLLP